jgi:hypothetical protein
MQAALGGAAKTLGPLRFLREDDGDVFEIDLRQRRLAAAAPQLIGNRGVDLLRYVERQIRVFAVVTPWSLASHCNDSSQLFVEAYNCRTKTRR